MQKSKATLNYNEFLMEDEDEFCWCKMCYNKHSEVVPNMPAHWSIESRILKSLGYRFTLSLIPKMMFYFLSFSQHR